MKNVKIAILSVSFLIIMSGTVVSPIIIDLKNHFNQSSQSLIVMVMTLPSLFIIPFSFLAALLAKKISKKILFLLPCLDTLLAVSVVVF